MKGCRWLILLALPFLPACAQFPKLQSRGQIDAPPISQASTKENPPPTVRESGKSVVAVSDDMGEGPSIEPVDAKTSPAMMPRKPARVDAKAARLPGDIVAPAAGKAASKDQAVRQTALLKGHFGESKSGPNGVQPGLQPGGLPGTLQGDPLHKMKPESILDPHCRTSPTAAGCLINLGPNESALERAIDLAKRLDASEGDRRALAERLMAMEATLESRNKLIREDETELLRATEDLIAARNELKKLREELSRLRRQLKDLEKEDLESMKQIIQALEKFLALNSTQ
jgi:polyhydroxyalkanoate synthesis regulator phasin